MIPVESQLQLCYPFSYDEFMELYRTMESDAPDTKCYQKYRLNMLYNEIPRGFLSLHEEHSGDFLF